MSRNSLEGGWGKGGGGVLGAAEIVWLMHTFVVTVLLTWNAASSYNKADKNAHSYWLKRRYWSLIPVNSLIMTTVTCLKWIWEQSSFRTPVTDSSPKLCIFNATACNYVVLLPIQKIWERRGEAGGVISLVTVVNVYPANVLYRNPFPGYSTSFFRLLSYLGLFPSLLLRLVLLLKFPGTPISRSL